MLKFSFVTLIVFGILVGCKSDDMAINPGEGGGNFLAIHPNEPWAEEVFELPFHANDTEVDFGDAYEIVSTSVSLAGDIISFRLGNSGGCAIHEYALYFNKVENQVAYIYVNHNANDDMCEAYFTGNFKANIGEILVRDDFADIILLVPHGDPIRVR